jgi:site-specific recombinase XerD
MTAFLEAFVRDLRAQDRSPHTVSAYESDARGFFAWLTERLGKAVPPIEVTTFDVQRYRDRLVDLGRQPSTVNRKLAALRVFFDWATQQEHASTNPAEDVNGVKQERRPPKALTGQQVYRLQREAVARCQLAEARFDDPTAPTVVTAYRDAALLNLLLYAGLRVSEAAALKRTDLDLGERKGTVIVRAGKGQKYRKVPLHKTARQALATYLEKCPTLADDDHVFQSQRGPLGARGMQLRIAALAEAADVKDVTPHVLRHTFATRLLREAETDLVTVSALLGHASVATTEIYTQPSERDLA